jgi:hypothetical protein
MYKEEKMELRRSYDHFKICLVRPLTVEAAEHMPVGAASAEMVGAVITS